jgi:hypothetical protein
MQVEGSKRRQLTASAGAWVLQEALRATPLTLYTLVGTALLYDEQHGAAAVGRSARLERRRPAATPLSTGRRGPLPAEGPRRAEGARTDGDKRAAHCVTGGGARGQGASWLRPTSPEGCRDRPRESLCCPPALSPDRRTPNSASCVTSWSASRRTSRTTSRCAPGPPQSASSNNGGSTAIPARSALRAAL